MGKTFEKCPGEVREILDDIVAKFHPELAEVRVTFDLLFAHAGEPLREGEEKAPAIKLHGYPCLAVVKINPHEKRVAGLADATIIIDGDQWPEWSDKKRRAVIDHEVTHIVVCRDKDGAVKSDDAGRPKLKMRPHDWQLGGFAEIIERHGVEAVERVAFNEAAENWKQLLLPWG